MIGLNSIQQSQVIFRCEKRVSDKTKKEISDRWYNNTILSRNSFYQEYKSQKEKDPTDLKVFSFYVYLAHINVWKFVVRYNLSEKEIGIMKELNCYKLPRRLESCSLQL